MTIKIPLAKDLKIKHLAAFEFLSKVDELTMEIKLKFISMFTNVAVEDLEDIDANQINDVFNALVKVASEIQPNETIKNELIVNGKRYVFIESLQKHPASWFTYCQRLISEGNLSAENIAAMVYIEHGKKYNQRGTNGEIINPVAKRENELYHNMLAADYLAVQGFFLSKLEQYTSAFSLVQMEKAKHQKLREKIASEFGLNGITF